MNTGVLVDSSFGTSIRNGTLRRFGRGILLDDTTEMTLIEDMVLDYNERGIELDGRESIVRRNRIVNTGWLHLERTYRYGIKVVGGTGHRVIDNDIVTVNSCICTPAEAASGIRVAYSLGALVVNNRITQAVNGVLFDGSTGAIRDNLTSGVSHPYLAINGYGYVDAGNNH